MTKASRSLTVPKTMQARLEKIVGITDVLRRGLYGCSRELVRRKITLRSRRHHCRGLEASGPAQGGDFGLQ